MSKHNFAVEDQQVCIVYFLKAKFQKESAEISTKMGPKNDFPDGGVRYVHT